MPAPTVAATGGNRDQKSPEEEAILPYYNNYLKEYRLGPSMLFRSRFFGSMPITASWRSPFLQMPAFRTRRSRRRLVAGKTVEQVAAEITKKLDEFIIDPRSRYAR